MTGTARRAAASGGGGGGYCKRLRLGSQETVKEGAGLISDDCRPFLPLSCQKICLLLQTKVLPAGKSRKQRRNRSSDEI